MDPDRKVKSQAALEFLTTYGWAILVVLVGIGALSYFGALNSGNFLPGKCSLQAGLGCLDNSATETSLTVAVQNSLGYDLLVGSVKADQCDELLPAAILSNGASGTYTLVCNNQGSKYAGSINITYTNAETGIQHTNEGEIIAALSGNVMLQGPGSSGNNPPNQPGAFEEMGFTGMGTVEYRISSSAGQYPQFKKAIVDPLDVIPGNNQTFTVHVYSPDGITGVTSITQLDTSILNLDFQKTDEYDDNGELVEVYSAIWTAYDTHVDKYNTKVTATDSAANSNFITLTWTDSCSGINQGSDSTLGADCTVGVSQTEGLDGGNLIVGAGHTITLNSGSIWGFNDGKSITLSGGTIAISGGSIQKGNLFYTDGDSDAVAADSTLSFSTSSSVAGKVRAMSAFGTSDCNDGSASVWQDLTCYQDTDTDTYTTGGGGPVCSGDNCPSGYQNSANGADCNDGSGSVWQTLSCEVDGDSDDYCGTPADDCVGAACTETCASGSDCNDGNGAIFTNSNCYTDGDDDNYDAGGPADICGTGSCGAGYSPATNGADCNDGNGAIFTNSNCYTDGDGDGWDGGGPADICGTGSCGAGYSAATSGSDCDDGISASTCSDGRDDGDSDGYCPVTEYCGGLVCSANCLGEDPCDGDSLIPVPNDPPCT